MDPKPRSGDSAAPAADRYHGFSLQSVCWGYRDIFRRTIETLLSSRAIGPDRPEVTEAFFGLLKRADQGSYDHVLRRFLEAIQGEARWLLDFPGLFVDVVELGHAFAAEKPHHGVAFFEILGRGGLGGDPGRVREALNQARRLREIDPEPAIAFLRGYDRLSGRLGPGEVGVFVDAGIRAYSRNRSAGLAFLEGRLVGAEAMVRAITREARLADLAPYLGRLLRALTGMTIAVEDIGALDTDDLLERGSTCVCLYRWLYLPARVRRFDDRQENADWYRLAALTAAAALAFGGFSRVHGHPDFPEDTALAGAGPTALNAFLLSEWRRLFASLRRHWPGARRLLNRGIRAELELRPPVTTAERVFAHFETGLALSPGEREAAEALEGIARSSVNAFATAARLTPDFLARLERLAPGLAGAVFQPLSFMPDDGFPGRTSVPPSAGLVADLKRRAEEDDADNEPGEEGGAALSAAAEEEEGGANGRDKEETDPADAPRACYLYDEWSRDENDYFRDYCFVYETRPAPPPGIAVPADVVAEGRRVSRVFERLKPDLARREKFLQEGDAINTDLLVRYQVQRREEASPRVDFYEKPRIRRRDLAVTVLLDASGSTGEQAAGSHRIIDVEKRAALILGQGLHVLGDRFAICGFSSNGREHCLFAIYKDFTEAWSRETMRRVMAAVPVNSTRIGPALRHCGWRMSALEARQRLIILITDGRPMDAGYDPNTRYAQYDVRKACEENARAGIHTFAISTRENSLADMEIMFPGRRFCLLAEIGDLPVVLPRLYTRLTL